MSYLIEKLTKEDKATIAEFADARCAKNTRLYEKRGGFKRSDIVIGAAAEIAVHRMLGRAGIATSEPDFKIYNVRKKSWAADLVAEDAHFCVKGQDITSANKYSVSWLFQQADPTFKVPIPGYYVTPCVVDYDKSIVYIYGCIPVMTIVGEDLFENTVLSHLQNNKMGLYLRKLTSKLQINQRWSILYKYYRSIR
jgi:hypothetical protein